MNVNISPKILKYLNDNHEPDSEIQTQIIKYETPTGLKFDMYSYRDDGEWHFLKHFPENMKDKK